MRWRFWLIPSLWLMTAMLLLIPGETLDVQATPSLALSNTDPEEVITVTIHSRTFEPDPVTLHVGQKTKLVFYNQDAELHTFVPVGLFVGVHLNVTGNGAPEFGADGFKRVIIPSEGRAEFRFVPERPGVYPFFCDMPGHEMKATIVVE